MMTLPAEIQKKKDKAVAASTALNAAITIAQMDPHSREDLICYFNALTEAQQVDDQEEIAYLINAIAEVFTLNMDAGTPDLDAWESEAQRSPEGRKAQQHLRQETEAFFQRYVQFKARMGLNTIRDVAEAARISPTTVQAIEAHRVKPQTRTLEKLAQAFKVTVADLLGG